MPISPPWYGGPASLDDLVGGFTRKVLALLGEDAGPGWRLAPAVVEADVRAAAADGLAEEAGDNGADQRRQGGHILAGDVEPAARRRPGPASRRLR